MTDTRTPTNCPECGHDGAFDGLGSFTRTLTRYSSNDGEERIRQVWAQMHCAECDGQFAILETEKEHTE